MEQGYWSPIELLVVMFLYEANHEEIINQGKMNKLRLQYIDENDIKYHEGLGKTEYYCLQTIQYAPFCLRLQIRCRENVCVRTVKVMKILIFSSIHCEKIHRSVVLNCGINRFAFV